MIKKLLSTFLVCIILGLLLTRVMPVSANYDPTAPKFSITSRVKITPKYVWTIDKTADTDSLILASGQSMTVNYTVSVNAIQVTSQAAIGVNFGVKNWAAEDLIVKSVAFTLNGSSSTFQCPTDTTVSQYEIFNCQFPGGGLYPITDTANPIEAVAVFTTDGGGMGSDIVTTLTKMIDFNYPTDIESPIDECITLNDTMAGNLGEVCTDSLPKTFTYSKTITAPSGECGSFSVANTATFSTNDTLTEGSDTWTVNYSVPCATGCSLTPGYWKTHSSNGPAPYDDTWSQIGETTIFYLSGQSYYDVLWTAPKGNPYYILAHAYIAAKLNSLNGADISAITSQMAFAETFFNTHQPSETLAKSIRSSVLNAATILDNYNNGLIGPGHCSE